MLMDVLPPSPVSRVWLGQLRLGLLFTQSVAPLRISLQSGAQPHLTGARARDPGKGGETWGGFAFLFTGNCSLSPKSHTHIYLTRILDKAY